MALWANTDDAANSTIFAAAQVNKAPNTTEQSALFGNTTADAYFTGATVGQFGVTPNEMAAGRAAGERPAAAGWVLRTEGSGGRAGRVFSETLVAMKTIGGDATDDTSFPDYTLSFTLQPVDSDEVSAGDDEEAVFNVTAVSAPTGASISYLWQYTTDPGNTASYATTAAVSGFAGQTTDELTVSANTIADGTLVRCRISATGADNVFSDDALLTVVA